MFAPELPTLCVGLRGMIYTEIEVRGAKTDLHSGMYGGAAPNAIFGLVELLAKLKEVGISKYSIFRRDQDLILAMDVDDFDAAWSALDRDPTNLKWQEKMSAIFEPVTGLKPGERFAMMEEVFYLD